jgi:hypothetical protein
VNLKGHVHNTRADVARWTQVLAEELRGLRDSHAEGRAEILAAVSAQLRDLPSEIADETARTIVEELGRGELRSGPLLEKLDRTMLHMSHVSEGAAATLETLKQLQRDDAFKRMLGQLRDELFTRGDAQAAALQQHGEHLATMVQRQLQRSIDIQQGALSTLGTAQQQTQQQLREVEGYVRVMVAQIEQREAAARAHQELLRAKKARAIYNRTEDPSDALDQALVQAGEAPRSVVLAIEPETPAGQALEVAGVLQRARQLMPSSGASSSRGPDPTRAVERALMQQQSLMRQASDAAAAPSLANITGFLSRLRR